MRNSGEVNTRTNKRRVERYKCNLHMDLTPTQDKLLLYKNLNVRLHIETTIELARTSHPAASSRALFTTKEGCSAELCRAVTVCLWHLH